MASVIVVSRKQPVLPWAFPQVHQLGKMYLGGALNYSAPGKEEELGKMRKQVAMVYVTVPDWPSEPLKGSARREQDPVLMLK